MRCLILITVVVAGCTDDQEPAPEHPPSGSPGGQPSGCPIPCPPKFLWPPSGKLAVGAQLAFQVDEPHPFFGTLIIESSDPSIVSIERPDNGRGIVVVRAHAAGTVMLSAHRPGLEKLVDSVALTAVDAASIEWRFRTTPIAPQPVTAIAGALGGLDHLRVAYRAADGEELLGRGDVEVTGDAVTPFDATSAVPTLASEVLDHSTAAAFGLVFSELGTATVTARLPGGPERALAVEVIGAPEAIAIGALVLDDDEVIAAPDEVEPDAYLAADVIATTSDGRFVAGVVADWTTVPQVTSVDAHSSELRFTPGAPGTLAVTATVGALQVTKQLVAR